MTGAECRWAYCECESMGEVAACLSADASVGGEMRGLGDLLRERKKEVVVEEVGVSIVWARVAVRLWEEKKGKEESLVDCGESGLPGLVEGVVAEEVAAKVEGLVEEEVARRDMVGRCEDILMWLFDVVELELGGWKIGGQVEARRSTI
jgi:hypothetical protein